MGLRTVRNRLSLVHISDTTRSVFKHDPVGQGDVPFVQVPPVFSLPKEGGLRFPIPHESWRWMGTVPSLNYSIIVISGIACKMALADRKTPWHYETVNSFHMAKNLSTITAIEPQSSLADRAFQKIVAAISRGEFEPGEFIKEARIAKQLGISRGPLREAMNRLEGRNLVERRPRLGVQVISLSQPDLEELFIMREALEGMACRQAASAMSNEALDQLSNLLEEHGRSEGLRTGADYYQGSSNEDFHFRIVRGSGNNRLIKALCDELYYQVRIYRYRSSARPGRARKALEEHRRIVEALRSRDPDRAEAAMREHIANARINLIWTEKEVSSIKSEAIRA